MTKLEPTKLCTYTPQVFDILKNWNSSTINLGRHIANELENYSGIVNIKFITPSSVADASIMPFSNNCTLSGFCQYQYIKYDQSVIYTKINLFGLYGAIGITTQQYGEMQPKFTQFTIIGSQIRGKETWLITKAIIDATIDSSAIYSDLNATNEIPADNGINTKSLTTTIDTDSIKNEILNSISSEYVSVASFSELKNQVDSADSDANSLASRIGLMSTTCTSLESKIDGLNGKYVDISNCLDVLSNDYNKSNSNLNILNSEYKILNTLAADISNKLNNQKDQADGYVDNFNEFVQGYNNQKNSMEEMFNSSITAWQKMIEDSSIKIKEATQAADVAYKAAIDACTMVDNYSVDISNRLNKLKMDISIADASFKQYKTDLLNAYKAAIGQFTAVVG